MYGHSSSLKNGMVLKILTSLLPHYFPYGARGLLARELSAPESLASGLEHFPSGKRALFTLQLRSADVELAKSNLLFSVNLFE
jgi:hypothetical protein